MDKGNEESHVYVLIYGYDTPDCMGSDLLGVYRRFEDAQERMNADVKEVKSGYPSDVWNDDWTWYEHNEIHLGFDGGIGYTTTYFWKIVEMEIR